MKFKKKALLGLMAFCLVGGVATTAALITTGATGTAKGGVDSVLYLEFGETGNVADVEGLGNVAIFRQVVIAAPTKSASVTGSFTVSFELTGTNLPNLTVDVSTDDLTKPEPTIDATLTLADGAGTYTTTAIDIATATEMVFNLRFLNVGTIEQAADVESNANLKVSMAMVE